MSTRISLGIVGARGHVGAELIRLVDAHPHFDLAYVCSRELAGAPVGEHVEGSGSALRYINPAPEDLPTFGAAAVVLALPNGKAADYVSAFDAARSDAVLVDLSADYRFDPFWYYGLPELTRASYAGQRRISNPGCYATAMQLAIAPLLDALDGPVQCFGVSGYSGAGTTPSDKNDPETLRDNLMPYALTGHLHEREVTRQLGHAVQFMPHVAPHFRGLTITANLTLARAFTRDEVVEKYREHYAGERLVHVADAAPWVSRIAGRHHVEIGGFAMTEDGRRVVIVATEDNLLKGASTQALQNLNLAFGLDEFAGIPVAVDTHAATPETTP